MDDSLWLVVTLTVRRNATAAFEEFERSAARIMARHGGDLAHALRLALDEPADTFQEVHLIRFPDEESFERYRQDAELTGLRSLRESAVVATQIASGRSAAWRDA